MAPLLSKPVYNKHNWSVQNPTEQWFAESYGDAGSKDGNVMDICFKVNTSPEIQNLLLS
jgi:hypothetical protein